MIRLSVGVDGITLRLPTGDQVTVDADQAQNLGNELLNCATAARSIAAPWRTLSNPRTTLASETP